MFELKSSCVGCRNVLSEGVDCPCGRSHMILSLGICQECEDWQPCGGGMGCRFASGCHLRRHLFRGGGCLNKCDPKFGGRNNPFVNIHRTTNAVDRSEQIAIITTHYNPQRFTRLRETYYEWLPSLGPMTDRLTCIELVMDDDDPEIAGSVVIRGTRERHTLWQKEVMLNIAIRKLPESVRYVAWIDHDIVIHDRNWLERSIALIDGGAIAVQLFSTMNFLALNRTIDSVKRGSVKHGTGCPGGAWIADRDYLDRIGGLWAHNIVGGGDVAFYVAATGHRGTWSSYFQRHQGEYAADFAQWVAMADAARSGRIATNLDCDASHLYHGSRENRQYVSREEIVSRNRFDPRLHVEIDSTGLLAWTDDAPQLLKREVAEYFERRREDD